MVSNHLLPAKCVTRSKGLPAFLTGGRSARTANTAAAFPLQGCQQLGSHSLQPHKLPWEPLTHPEGDLPARCWFSAVLLNPDVNTEIGTPAAAMSKQREQVPVTWMSSCGTELQQNLAAQGDKDYGAEGTMTGCSPAASCVEIQSKLRPPTQVVSRTLYSLLGTSEQGKRHLGSFYIEEDAHRHPQ